MRLVPINCVKPGSFLGKTLFDNNGRVLLREGVKLSDGLINGIKNVHIYSIYINDEYSYNELQDIIEPQLRQKTIQSIKDMFLSFNVKDPKSNTISSKGSNHYRDEYFKSIRAMSEEIIEQIMDQRDIMINLVDIKSMDNYTYQHCVNVAVLSLVLGLKLELDRIELLNLAMGALLHDIGKVFTPKELLQKKGSLTPQEFSIVKEHTTRGYDYLKLSSLEIPAPARIICLQHHEKVNGNGYPECRKKEDINKLSKIVAITDVYDALTSDRPYRRAMSPNEALEYIMANGDIQFDYEMVKTFASTIIPYPTGTLVRLSNEDIGVVEDVDSSFPLRPKIKIIKSNSFDMIGKIIDLKNKLDLVISEIKYDSPA